MAYCTGAVIVKDKMQLVSGFINDVNINLPDSEEYYLSLDQSTTCTGLYLTTSDYKFHLLIDLMREGTDKAEFYRQLKYFILRLVSGKVVKLFLMEDVPNTDDKHTKQVLRDLKHMIEEWRKTIPELDRAEHECVLPQVWKHEIVDKSKGTKRSRSKRATAEDLCDKVPELKQYLDIYTGAGFDCFDACGILHGFIRSRSTENGFRCIMGPLNSRYEYEAYYLTGENPEKIKELLTSLFEKGNDTVYRVWNESYSVRDNYRMAAGCNDITVTDITNLKLKVRLLWEFDIPMDVDVLCIIIRRVHVSPALRSEIIRASNKRLEVI